MSVAFTKESDAEAVAADVPDRPIPPHANLVTPAGLAQIDAELAVARAAYAAAQAGTAISADRTAMARATRDLRYWAARRASAQLIETPRGSDTAVFGSRVTLAGADGRTHCYAIVGDDEASPPDGSISYMAPLARALIGKSVGDVVRLAGRDAEITGIA